MQQPVATVSRRPASGTPAATTTNQWWQAGVYMYAAIGVAAAGLVLLAAMAVYHRRQARSTKVDKAAAPTPSGTDCSHGVQPVKTFTRVASGGTGSASGRVVKQAW